MGEAFYDELAEFYHLMAGFTDILWLEPGSTSFYQPIVVATKASR
jgi:hypothetical protein